MNTDGHAASGPRCAASSCDGLGRCSRGVLPLPLGGRARAELSTSLGWDVAKFGDSAGLVSYLEDGIGLALNALYLATPGRPLLYGGRRGLEVHRFGEDQRVLLERCAVKVASFVASPVGK